MKGTSAPDPVRVVALDDYQGVAGQYHDWHSSSVPIELIQIREHIEDQHRLKEILADAHVIIAMRERTPLSADLLKQLNNLQLVVTTGMRNDSIEPASDVIVCGTRILGTPAVELTWALILASRRHVISAAQGLREGRWEPPIGTGLSGQTLAILGLGKAGGQVATIGKSFGMRVIAWSPNLTKERTDELGVELVSKEKLFAEADILSIHLRLGGRSRGLVASPLLATMKRDALLVNTARAEIVDEEALALALHQGWIGAAALDVFPQEPLPQESPLRHTPRTLLTPHIGYVVEQNYQMFFTDALECVEQFYRGTPVRLISDGTRL